MDLHERQQQPSTILTVDNEPLYKSISGNLTSSRIVDVVSPSLVIEEESFVERVIMKDVGNVTNTREIVNGVGKGVITTEEGRNMISWNAYDLGISRS